MDVELRRHLTQLVDGADVPLPPLTDELRGVASRGEPGELVSAPLPPIWQSLSQLVAAPKHTSEGESTGAASVLLQHLDSNVPDAEARERIWELVMDTLEPHDHVFDADAASAVLIDLLGFDRVELIAMLVANPRGTASQLRVAQARRAQGIGSAKEPLVLAPSSDTGEQYPHVYGSGEHGSVLSAFGTRFTLPAGTQRIHEPYYEEVIIPRSQPLPFRKNERLVSTDEMDVLCRGAFKHYKTLNRLQSAVYPMAYETHENLLVCAPTGAGKTDVAMLCVLQCISRYIRYGTNDSIHVDKSAFKIVYVAPMKALVSEIVSKFQKRLSYLGLTVRELTGDMQLTRRELAETQMIVTTPEKWDVVTRKPMGDGDLALAVRLLIIDEVHLLHEDRGAVIETIVARTQRLVESTQSMIRIVGLSATLPNYVDVADFLGVNRYKGLFYFGAAFRPVPLEQHFIGVRGKHGSMQSRSHLDRVAYETVLELARGGHPVMVFVHTRKDTVKTAQALLELGKEDDLHGVLTEGRDAARFERDVTSSRNRELRELFEHGIGIHHAGMLRSDRDLSERLFAAGATRVLCCTATLAWGVNLPAYAVIIKGTDVYDAEQGRMVDLGILDVLQIFGRAGRPQYEDVGVAYICTSGEKLTHYIDAITSAHPIESTFLRGLIDALNSEIALGSVSTLDDGISWLGFTYLYTRLRKAPRVYGLDAHDIEADPSLMQRRRHWIAHAAQALVQHGMVIFDMGASTLRPTNTGRIASRYYLSHKTIGTFLERLRNGLGEADALDIMSRAADFEQIALRENEEDELRSLMERVPCEVGGGTSTAPGKVNILLQAHVSYLYVDDFALVSDMRYVAQNTGRVLLALFELSLDRGFATSAASFLQLAKAVDKRIWPFEHPLRQYPTFTADMAHRISTWADDLEVSQIKELPIPVLAQVLHTNDRIASVAHAAAERFPSLHVRITARPAPDGHVRLDVYIKRTFVWDERIHGSSLALVWWVEDAAHHVMHADRLVLRPSSPLLWTKDGAFDHHLHVFVPLSPPDVRPTSEAQCCFVWSSLHWLHAEGTVDVDLDELACPQPTPAPTPLLPLPLLPVGTRSDAALPDALGVHTLNAVQTQAYHTIAHSRANALVCAPYAAGKWTLALFAIARAWTESEGSILIVEPDAIRREERTKVLEKLAPVLGGHVDPVSRWNRPRCLTILSPDEAAALCSLKNANIALAIFLHIHQLSPAYELGIMQIQRLRAERIIATSLSTSTGADLGAWLHIPTHAMFAFPLTAAPYPVATAFDTVDIPYSDTLVRAYAKPAFDRMEHHGDVALLFVPTRAQCVTAAQELGARLAMQSITAHNDAEHAAQSIEHQGLAHLVRQGLAFWHAGLSAHDQSTVERLVEMRCLRAVLCAHDEAGRVPIYTSLVMVLGTQYAHSKSVHDYSLEKLRTMQRHAVRPHNAEGGTFVVMCQQLHMRILERLLNTPVAIESALTGDAEMLNALIHELDARRIHTRFHVMGWLATSYFAVRVRSNPAWYGEHGENGRTDPNGPVSSLCDTLIAQGEHFGLWRIEAGDTLHLMPFARGATVAGIARLLTLTQSVLYMHTVPDAVEHILDACNDEGDVDVVRPYSAKAMLDAVHADRAPVWPRALLAYWLTPLLSSRTLPDMDDALVNAAGEQVAARVIEARRALLLRIMKGPNIRP